jgi:hypothetical protein
VVLGSEKEILNPVLCEGDSGDLWVDDSLSEAEIIELSEWPRKAKNPWCDRAVAAVVSESGIRSFPVVRSFGMNRNAKPEILLDSAALPIVPTLEKLPQKFPAGVFCEGTVLKKKKRLADRAVRVSLFSFVFVILLVCSRIFLREQLGFSPCLRGSRSAGAKYLRHVLKEMDSTEWALKAVRMRRTSVQYLTGERIVRSRQFRGRKSLLFVTNLT